MSTISARRITGLVFSLSLFMAQSGTAESKHDVTTASTATAELETDTTTGPLPPVAAPAEEALDPRVTDQIASAISLRMAEDFPVKVSYGSKGFRLESRDGNWQTNLQWRFQFRLTNPTNGDPRSIGAFQAKDKTTFEARRLRMKIGGHGYKPWLKYYFELDLQPTRASDDSSSKASTRVIDWRVDIAKKKEFGVRLGQWKIDYNRERVDSSGRQQFVERSIVNRVFTIDRQVGVSFRGHLFEGTHADMRYYAGIFTGEGRGVSNDDNNLMYAGRLQWNFLGRDLPLRQTDVERTKDPTASLAFGFATNKGVCTRWSSSGCGNTSGFSSPSMATRAQYRVHQAVQELAYKHQGFSFQQEFHWKRIIDRNQQRNSSRRDTDLFGGYAQAGYFFHEIFDSFPEELEFAFRYAYVREPNSAEVLKVNTRQEYTAGANWFFAGHNNKITVDYSYLTLNDNFASRNVSDHRGRVQWDISF